MPRKTPRIRRLEGEDVPGLRRDLHGGREQGNLPAGAGPGLGRIDLAQARRRGGQPVVPGHPPEPALPVRRGRGRRLRRQEGGGRRRVRHRPRGRHADAPERALVARGRPLPPLGGSAGQERAGGQLRGRQRGRPADRGGWPAGRGLDVHPAFRPRRPPEAARGPARPLDQPRRRESVRGRGRPRPRQGPRLPVRPRQGDADPQRPPRRAGQARLRPAPLRVPSRRPPCLRLRGDHLRGDRLRLRPRARDLEGHPDPLDAPRRGQGHPEGLDGRGAGPPLGQVPLRLEPRPRQHRHLRHRPQDRPAPAPSATSPPGARPPATSASTRRGPSCSPPTRTPTPSSSSGSIRRPACSSRPDTRRTCRSRSA